MTALQGTLIFADGYRIAGIEVRLYNEPLPWNGAFLVPPEHRQLVADTFRQRVHCELLLEDGRVGTILLTGLGAMTRFLGTGPLEMPGPKDEERADG